MVEPSTPDISLEKADAESGTDPALSSDMGKKTTEEECSTRRRP
jgi:hypothetical protein